MSEFLQMISHTHTHSHTVGRLMDDLVPALPPTNQEQAVCLITLALEAAAGCLGSAVCLFPTLRELSPLRKWRIWRVEVTRSASRRRRVTADTCRPATPAAHRVCVYLSGRVACAASRPESFRKSWRTRCV